MFPFHTWLPAAHVEAPTAGSVILASVLLKMGTYGFLRFCLPITPGAAIGLLPALQWLSIAGIIYGGLTALAQQDMKKLIAYSSVGHMGFVTLGIFALNQRGLEGALLQMINHGVTTGALFLCVGMVYERSHSRELADAAGLGKFMPIYVTYLTFFFAVVAGLPRHKQLCGRVSYPCRSLFQQQDCGSMRRAGGHTCGGVHAAHAAAGNLGLAPTTPTSRI